MKIAQFIKNRSKKFWIRLVILVIIVGSVVFVVITLNAPSVGTIKQAPPKQVNTASTTSTSVDGKTASFSIPSNYHPKESDQSDTMAIEKFSYVNPQLVSQNLEIQVRKLPTGSLEDALGYQARKQNPAKYSFETRTIGNNVVTIVSDTSEGYSKVVYITNKNSVALLSWVSATSNPKDIAQLDADLDKVVGSWQWL